jgi:hypothetical protein
MSEELEKIADDPDKVCVHYRASRNIEKNRREGSVYEPWGCYECNGINEECERYAPLGEIKFPTEE